MTRRPVQPADSRRDIARTRMAPGGRRWSESPVRRPYPRVRQLGAPAVGLDLHWPMDDASGPLLEASGGPPFTPYAATSYRVAPLAAGSTHAASTDGISVMLGVADVTGWVTWDFWVTLGPESSYHAIELRPGSENSGYSHVRFTPGGIVFLHEQAGEIATVPTPPAPVHVQWSYLLDVPTAAPWDGTVTRSVIRINGATVDDQAVAGAWRWWAPSGSMTFQGNESGPVIVDEVRLYSGQAKEAP